MVLLLKHNNVLLLDEPTNHLDIPGKEALEEALHDFTGTILFVSHDRYFIQQLSTDLLLLEEGRATYIPESYAAYEERQKESLEKQKEEKKDKERKSNSPAVAVREAPARSAQGVRREISKIENQITDKERELEANRELRYEPEYYQDYQKMQVLDEHIDDIHNELAHLYARWEELNS